MTRMSIFACSLLLFAQPVFAITVGEAVDTALKNNPDLQSVRLEKDTAQGRLDQAGLLLRSNPVIEGSLSRKDTQPDGGEKAKNYEVRLSQEFELAGQRGLRVDAARSGWEKALLDIRDRERVLIAAVKDAFARALAAKRKIDLAEEAVKLQEELVASATVKFQTGDISALEQNLADVELGKARRDRMLAERERREAMLGLQEVLGMKPSADFTVEGELPSETPAIPDREKIRDADAPQRSDVQSAAADVQQAKAAMKLAGREAIPSVTVSGFYNRDTGLNEAGVMLSLPLPFFDRKQADRKEAATKAGQALIRQASLERIVVREIEEAHANLVAAVEELNLFKKDVLGKAMENLSLMNLAFKEGKFGFFEVRLAQKDTIDAQFAYLESQVRLQLALNAWEKATGGSQK
ncbi:MAG: TolC family protein [Nitrospirae bacterium]|nr:TolC family protein [Nitrospirota bacterium]NTW66573.1 TolC family protein [Nitrospirota bacterium]